MNRFFTLVSMMFLFVAGTWAADVIIPTNKSTFSASGDDYVATSDDVTLTYSKGGATTNPSQGVVDAHLRVYKNAILTISSSKDIEEIVVTSIGGNYGSNGFTAEGYVAAEDKMTGTWKGSSKSIVLTATNNQVRLTQVEVTFANASDSRDVTTISFAEGYKTQIAHGPDGMFPEVGSKVDLPTATVMAGDAAVAGAAVTWSMEVRSWKEGKPQPVLGDGIITFEGGSGEVMVTASYAGNNSYKASEKSYTLKFYNTYGLLSEMVNDIADPKCEKSDDNDTNGRLTFYFFRNIDADGFPVVTNTVTYAKGQYIYLRDDAGNNLLFYGTNSQKLKQGDMISGNVSDTNLGGFWGTLKRYNKLPEFAFDVMNVKVESEGNAVEPATITADNLVDNINNYVKIENAEFVSASSKNLTFKAGETELAVYNQWSVDVATLAAGHIYTLTGMGSIYKKGDADPVYQLYLIDFVQTGVNAGIHNVEVAAQQGKVYNLQGQRVENARKGLYIIDGKKMIMK